MNTKRQSEFIDTGFGFPVRLKNVPMVKIQGVWTPDINYNDLALKVLQKLATQARLLTGREVHFIRLHFRMTLKAFAKRFGVTHPAVVKWEKTGDDPINANWTTEKDIRLFVLERLGARPADFLKIYLQLEVKPSAQRSAVHVYSDFRNFRKDKRAFSDSKIAVTRPSQPAFATATAHS